MELHWLDSFLFRMTCECKEGVRSWYRDLRRIIIYLPMSHFYLGNSIFKICCVFKSGFDIKTRGSDIVAVDTGN